MHLDRKLEKYLVGSIDFDTFYLVAVEPVNDKYALIILAPKALELHSYFNARYGNTNHWASSIEEATDAAVKAGFISRLKAKKINDRYYNVYRGGKN